MVAANCRGSMTAVSVAEQVTVKVLRTLFVLQNINQLAGAFMIAGQYTP